MKMSETKLHGPTRPRRSHVQRWGGSKGPQTVQRWRADHRRFMTFHDVSGQERKDSHVMFMYVCNCKCMYIMYMYSNYVYYIMHSHIISLHIGWNSAGSSYQLMCHSCTVWHQSQCDANVPHVIHWRKGTPASACSSAPAYFMKLWKEKTSRAFVLTKS